MCQIQTTEFVYNGSTLSAPCLTHSLDPNGTLSVEAGVTFDGLEVGNNYKCELKVRVPDGTEVSFYTPLKSVRASELFSITFTTPIIAGQYDIVWIAIYNSVGQTVCSGMPSSAYCQSVSVSSTTSTYNITLIAGTGGQIQVFRNSTDLGYFRGTKIITANFGDSISVWCDPDSGYVFSNLCITGTQTCTTARPFDFTANMNISMSAIFTSSSTTPPPPCQPPQDQRYCKDTNTICVWNSSSCAYDCAACQNPPCTNGQCALPCGACSSSCLDGTCSQAGYTCQGGTCKIATTLPPKQWTCDPVSCPDDGRNYCISGTCIPKSYVMYGIAIYIAMIMFRK